MTEYTSIFSSPTIDAHFEPYLSSLKRGFLFKENILKKVYFLTGRCEMLVLLNDTTLDAQRRFMRLALKEWPTLLDQVMPIMLEQDIEPTSFSSPAVLVDATIWQK